MASIRKRKGPYGRDVWQAWIRISGYPEKFRTFDTKTEAKDWARRIEADMKSGIYRDYSRSEKALFSEIVDKYRKEVVPKLRGRVEPYLRALEKGFGDYALANITPEIIAQHRDQRLEHVATQTARHDLAILRRILNVAIKEWGYHLPHGNPVEHVKLPPPGQVRERRLDPDEEARLLKAAAAEGRDIHDMIVLALETAMRRGELAAIIWERVDFDAPAINMPAGAKNKPGRRVPLSSRALEVLKTRYEVQAVIDGDQLEGSIWSDLKASDSISQAFGRVRVNAEINDLRFHDLRHEATSRLVEKGFQPVELAKITGHTTTAMLMRYYHPRVEELAKRMG